MAGFARRALLLVAAAQVPGPLPAWPPAPLPLTFLLATLPLAQSSNPSVPDVLRLVRHAGRLAACRMVAAGPGTAWSAGGAADAAAEDESDENTAPEGRRVDAHRRPHGLRGVSGPVIMPLCGPCHSPLSGSATPTAALKAGKTYVNVHTAKSPGGEVRGQLTRAM